MGNNIPSVAVATDSVPLAPAGERTLPAFVVAEAETDPRVTSLVMQPEVDGGLGATLEHGAGQTLDDQSTLQQTRTELTDDEVELATIAGNLASRSGFDPEAALREVEEETGLKELQIKEPLISTYHTYRLKGKKILKKTRWFEMYYKGSDSPVLESAEGITDYKWTLPGQTGFIRENTFASIMDVLYMRKLL